MDLKKAYPGYEMYDEFEEERLEHLAIAKARGKGAPKKKKSAAGELCQYSTVMAWTKANARGEQNRERLDRRRNERNEDIETGAIKPAFGPFGIACERLARWSIRALSLVDVKSMIKEVFSTTVLVSLFLSSPLRIPFSCPFIHICAIRWSFPAWSPVWLW